MRRHATLLCLFALLGCTEQTPQKAPTAAELVAVLSEEPVDEARFASAATSLRALGESAVPALSPALRGEVPLARDEALRVLANLGPAGAEAVPDLLFLMRGAQESVREPAREVLGGMGDAALPHLLASLRADDWQDRAPAVRCLAELGPAARELVLPLLADPFLRAGAVDFLLFTESTEGISPGDLKGALGAKDSELRRNALAVLLKTEGTWEEVRPRLAALTDDPDEEVVLRVIQALKGNNGRAPTPFVETHLTRLLEHEDSGVRLRALYAADELWRVLPPGLLAALLKLARDPDENMRAAALSAIARSGADHPECLDLLIEGFADEDPYVRTACARAIALYRSEAAAAVPGLIEALKIDPGGGVYEVAQAEALMRAAMDALVAIGAPAKTAGPALLDLLSHQEDHVAGNAARVLAALEVEMSSEQLLLAFRRLRGSRREEAYLRDALLPLALRDAATMSVMIEVLSEPARGPELRRFVAHLVYAGAPADPLVPAMVESLATTHFIPIHLAVQFFTGREEVAVPLLEQALARAGPDTRLRILGVLCRLKADDEALVLAAREALASSRSELRALALETISGLVPVSEELLPDLIPLLLDKDAEVFASVLPVLKNIGDAALPAVPTLERIVENTDEKWRGRMAAELIERLTGKD